MTNAGAAARREAEHNARRTISPAKERSCGKWRSGRHSSWSAARSGSRRAEARPGPPSARGGAAGAFAVVGGRIGLARGGGQTGAPSARGERAGGQAPAGGAGRQGGEGRTV